MSSTKIHGEYRMMLIGQIMCVHAIGPWNEECVQQFQIDYKQHSLACLYAQWADLVVLSGESLLIPSAERFLIQAAANMKSKGLRCVAIMFNDSIVKMSTQEQFTRVYANSGLDVGFFEHLADATDWLTNQNMHCELGKITNWFAPLGLTKHA
jgi:hypothetical protein